MILLEIEKQVKHEEYFRSLIFRATIEFIDIIINHGRRRRSTKVKNDNGPPPA